MYVRHGRHGGCCPRQLPHRSRARVPFYILQSPFLLSFPYLCFIRMDFLTRLRSDATAPILGKLSPHAVRISPHVCACPPARPSGRSAVSPPSLLPPCSPSESSRRPTATSCITAGTAASLAGWTRSAGEEALTPSTMRVGVRSALWASHAVSLSPSLPPPNKSAAVSPPPLNYVR